MTIRKVAKIIANLMQGPLAIMYDGPMDGYQVEEFSEMLQEEINKLMGNVRTKS